MNPRTGFTGAALFAVLLLVGPLASANIIVTKGVDNTGVDNVIANAACDPLLTGPAFTVQGCLNTSHSTLVNFTSDEDIIYDGGQAAIEAVDGDFRFLQIALADPDFTFSKLLLNIDALADPTGGSVIFTGVPGGASQSFDLDPGGENHFIITGEDFSNVSFATSVGITSFDLAADVKQVRIGGFDSTNPDNPPPPPVPTPGILSLFGLALVTLVGMRRRRMA